MLLLEVHRLICQPILKIQNSASILKMMIVNVLRLHPEIKNNAERQRNWINKIDELNMNNIAYPVESSSYELFEQQND